MRALSILLILIFMQMGCTGLVVYELVSSSQFIADNHEETPVVNVRYYYDDINTQPKKDKSHMYPPPKSEFKHKKGE
jgi:hypothetical protein